MGAEGPASLARLEAREFLQRAPASRVAGEVEYAFRHTLVRDVAYGQIPRADRVKTADRNAFLKKPHLQ